MNICFKHRGKLKKNALRTAHFSKAKELVYSVIGRLSICGRELSWWNFNKSSYARKWFYLFGILMRSRTADCKVRTINCMQSVENEQVWKRGEDLRSLQLNTLCLLNFKFSCKILFLIQTTVPCLWIKYIDIVYDLLIYSDYLKLVYILVGLY